MENKEIKEIQNILLERIREMNKEKVDDEYLKVNNSITTNANAIIKANIYMLSKEQFEKKYETE